MVDVLLPEPEEEIEKDEIPIEFDVFMILLMFILMIAAMVFSRYQDFVKTRKISVEVEGKANLI